MARKVLAVIPSRIGSTRLPRKPLVKINGTPLIQHVYEGALQSKLVSKLIVATDSEEIVKCVQGFGAEAILTVKNHKTGSDRIAEVAEEMPDYEIVVNIQGDVPLVNGEMVDALIEPLIENDEIEMTALKSKITNKDDLTNPSIVKVVTDKDNFALYFSRSAVPYIRDNLDIIYYRNKGLYGFRRGVLLKYAKMPQTDLEEAESLEQLRALENGIKIYVAETDVETFEVNIPKDIKIVEKELKRRDKK